MAEHPTDLGMNKTGISLSPIDSGKLIEGAKNAKPTSEPDGFDVEKMRSQYIEKHIPIGSMPPPVTAQGMFSTAKQMVKGNKSSVLLDKLGERLAFERTGVRLYELLMAKAQTLLPSDQGLQNRFRKIQSEEMRHFQVLKRSIEQLGGDPTAMTPCADVTSVNSMGLLQTIGDPRTTLSQSLGAILIAEAADNEGWDLLIKLCDAVKEVELKKEFTQCKAEEDEHLRIIRQLVSVATMDNLQNRPV